MKKKLIRIVFLIFLTPIVIFSHSGNTKALFDRDWNINNRQIHGSFYMLKDNKVYIEQDHNHIVSFPYAKLSKQDRLYTDKRYNDILHINAPQYLIPNIHSIPQTPLYTHIFFVLIGIILLLMILFRYQRAYAWHFACIALVSMTYSFKDGMPALQSVQTDPSTIDSAFTPFKEHVITSWDKTYFRVGSLGLATTHEMMKGITSWQQQVPIPQCYLDNNAWSIPLNPIMAINSVPVNQTHCTRGGIAIAVNGIAIFNPYTNTGVDAYVDGQLDNWGGHCGRADDYHYHIAPTHLYSFTKQSLPIAYAFDGFAIYGDKEPDGSDMKSLDIHHGHAGTNGVYHYHGTLTVPYTIASFAGEVTEDSTYQIIPQSTAKGCRPALTPLKGATITGMIPNQMNNGYTLSYTLNNQINKVDYSWTQAGSYTFYFTSATGTTTNQYKGQTICSLPTSSVQEDQSKEQYDIQQFSDRILVQSLSDVSMLSAMQLSLFTVDGKLAVQSLTGQNLLSTQSLPFGLYFLSIQPGNLIKSFIVKP